MCLRVRDPAYNNLVEIANAFAYRGGNLVTPSAVAHLQRCCYAGKAMGLNLIDQIQVFDTHVPNFIANNFTFAQHAPLEARFQSLFDSVKWDAETTVVAAAAFHKPKKPAPPEPSPATAKLSAAPAPAFASVPSTPAATSAAQSNHSSKPMSDEDRARRLADPTPRFHHFCATKHPWGRDCPGKKPK